jgi:hypothetical protein
LHHALRVARCGGGLGVTALARDEVGHVPLVDDLKSVGDQAIPQDEDAITLHEPEAKPAIEPFGLG